MYVIQSKLPNMLALFNTQCLELLKHATFIIRSERVKWIK